MKTVIFRSTGEHRRVKAGDWYENIDGSFKQALFGTAVEHYIYTMEEVNQTEENETTTETNVPCFYCEKEMKVDMDKAQKVQDGDAQAALKNLTSKMNNSPPSNPKEMNASATK